MRLTQTNSLLYNGFAAGNACRLNNQKQLSAFFFLYSFMQMPAGWLVDRFGVKKAYAIGFIVCSIAAACTGLAGGFYTLIVFQLILGVGQSVAFPASARAVANWFQIKERGIVTLSDPSALRLYELLRP